MFDSLRLRLTYWYTGIFGLVLVAFGLATYGFVSQALYSGVEDGARIVAKSIQRALSIDHGRIRVDQAEFKDQVTDSATFQGVLAIQIVDGAGREVVRQGILARLPAIGAPEDQRVSIEGNPLWIHNQPIYDHDRPVGTIRVVRSLSDLNRTLHRFLLILCGLIPVALFGTVLGGVVMAGKVMTPIQAAFERLRRFTADASHELRTPLAIIQAQLDSLDDEHLDSEKLARQIEPVRRASRRMAALVSDLLFLARSDASEVELQSVRLDLDELVEETVEAYRPVATAKGLELVFEASPVTLLGDPQRLHQMVSNLVENAIKYTDSGTITVTLAPHGPQHHALLTVVDTGPGIDPSHLPRVFDRFYRADAARAAQKPGTGLGLAIAKAIVLAHRGAIHMQSEVGQGTQVIVSLPS